MNLKTIISCALTGAGDTTHLNPAVPVTPQQIADEAIAAHGAGAAIVHIHVRDPATGKASVAMAHYKETVDRIRESGCGVLINLTTGAGARFVPGARDPNKGSADSKMMTPEARVEHILELKPDLCSLDIATMNFGSHAFVNIPDHIVRMARMIESAGVKAEIEVFDLGHVRLANHLIAEHGILGNPLFQLCLGVPWGAPADTETMLLMKRMLPAHAHWSAFGISRYQFTMVAQSFILGGHVRVGLEDNLYIAKGKLAPGNAALVTRARRIIDVLGGALATSADAATLLGLRA